MPANEYLSTSNLAAAVGVTIKTVNEWCKAKKIESIRRGRFRLIPRHQLQFAISLASSGEVKKTRLKKKEENEENEEKKIKENNENKKDSEKKVSGQGNDPEDMNLSKFEYERLIKREEAIKKRRENQIRDQQLFYRSDLEEILTIHYAEFLHGTSELVDHWAVKYNFSPRQTKEMSGAYVEKLNNAWAAIKGKIKQCRHI